MPQWEYDRFNLNEVPRKTEDIDLLNDAGKDGWELVAITGNNVAYMKRQLNAAAPAQEKQPPAQPSVRRTAASSRAGDT